MDISPLTAELSIGSAPKKGTITTEICDLLVLAACNFQPPDSDYPEVQVLKVPLIDGGQPPSIGHVRIAINAARAIVFRIREGDRVLVTCEKGHNRSALVAGMALLGLGWSAPQAIKAIVKARGDAAFSNKYFVGILRRYMADGAGTVLK